MKKPKYTKDWGAVHKEEKKKKVSKAFIWTLIISGVMIFSTIGFIYVGNEEAPSFTYKEKYKILRENNAFIFQEGNNQFAFKFFPSELESFVNGTDLSKLKKPMFYITFDPNSELVQSIDLLRFELSDDAPKLNIHVGQGVINASEEYNLTIIDCGDATADIPVIKFVKSNETKIVEEDNCFIFNAKNDYDVVKLRDVLLYSLLGIL
jgi:hypothetical protein